MEITVIEPSPFVGGFVYGEGPRWHHGRLWFTDGPAGKVYSVGEMGDVTVEARVPHASGLGWLPDGTLVVSALFDAKVHCIGIDGTTNTVDLSDICFTTNDCVVSADGRVYVNLYRVTDTGLTGDIGLFEHDGTVRVVANEVAVPNGMGFLSNGNLLVNEVNGSRILEYSVEPDGSLGKPTIFAEFSADRHPDGLCVDAEDAVWIGSFDSGEFLRVVRGGIITHRVPIEQGWSVAPALGGSDGRTLYLVVDHTTVEKLPNGESTCEILQARVDVPGAGSP